MRSGHDNAGFTTRLVHDGEHSDVLGAVSTPIYETASFVMSDLAQYDAVEETLSTAPFYSRGYNPTVRALEEKLAAIEGAEDALAFSAGMAAVTTTLLGLVPAGKHLIASSDVFVTSRLWLRDNLPAAGADVTMLDIKDLNAVERAIRPETTAIFFELQTNPLLKMVDLDAVVELAHSRGLLVIVDNTFLSPYLNRPLEHGADLVVHSTTKHLAGHGRVLGGVVAGPSAVLGLLAEVRRRMGTIASPHAAALTSDGVKTLSVRLDRQCATALHLATCVDAHPLVVETHYPGLPSHADHKLAAQLTGARYGAVIAFRLRGTREVKRRVYDSFELVTRATSLGDVASLVDSYDEPDLLRVAVGIEDPADLEADLMHALDEGWKMLETQ